jgi:hypothetical protein
MGMGKNKPPPPKAPASEYSRFKDLLRRLIAVPKKEVDKEIAALRERREKGEPEPDT